MKSSRKFIVMVPPLLIGITALLFAFTYQHQQNLAHQTNSQLLAPTTSAPVVVTEPLPPPTPGPDNPVIRDLVACTLEARQCPDGSFVGRSGPDCAFDPCPGTEVRECSPESRLAEACAEIYAPVCASVAIECITEPCEPIPETFSNNCFACANERVIAYTNGECAQAL